MLAPKDFTPEMLKRELEQIDDDIATLRKLSADKYYGNIVTQVQPMPYPVMNTLLDGGFPDGALNYWLSSFTTGMSDDLIDTVIRLIPGVLGDEESAATYLAELTDRYADRTGIDLSHIDYYRCFNHWKTACIVQGEVHHLQGRTKTTRRWLERALAIVTHVVSEAPGPVSVWPLSRCSRPGSPS